jgi:putative nucleotidyltransferase with HDIG domain
VRAAEDYEGRLNAILAHVSALSGLPDSYLYLVDASERRLHLALSRARPAGDPTRMAPSPLNAQLEGGAEFSAPTAPLELIRTEDSERERTATTPVGKMHSLPLWREDERLLGVVQAGPLARGDLGRGPRKRLQRAAGPLAAVIEQVRREESLRQELAAARARLEGGQRLAGSAVDLDRFVALLLDLALNTTGAAGGFVATVDPDGGPFAVRTASGLPPRFADEVNLSPEGGLFDWSPAAEGGALVLQDFEAAARLGLHSLLAVPLVEEREPLGIFALDFGAGGVFDEAALELLEQFAGQIRLMLHNARLFGDFSDRYLDTVEGLARALDARRPYTHGHHQLVARVAVEVAAELGAEEPEREAIAQAGLIHDVGLAGTAGIEGGSDADVEHPTLGASLIEHLPLPPVVAGAVATHHEWFDGWGFPRGLHGDEIPRAGRVLALAEFAAEMGTGDEVRDPWPVEKIAEEIGHRRGSQFDPDVADAALRLAERGALELAVPAGA